MKNLLRIILATLSVASLTAQSSQPLYIPSLTIIPNGCSNPTATLEVIAKGGQPDSKGNYTYSLDASMEQTAPTATFTDVATGDLHTLTVTDSTKTSITWDVTFSESQTESVNVSLALPLGDGTGCIALTSVNPPSTVDFQLFINGGVENVVVDQAPFTHTFSAPPAATNYTVAINPSDDCGTTNSFFQITFPFPQGIASAITTYLVNKYCANCGQGSAS